MTELDDINYIKSQPLDKKLEFCIEALVSVLNQKKLSREEEDLVIQFHVNKFVLFGLAEYIDVILDEVNLRNKHI